jgi:hypothetical protein
MEIESLQEEREMHQLVLARETEGERCWLLRGLPLFM